MNGTRGKAGETPSQLVLGEFHARLYNSSLLFFSFSLLPLPGNGFPTEDTEAARRQGSQSCPSRRSLPLPDQHQEQAMFWSCNMYIPVPFSDAVNEFFFHKIQMPAMQMFPSDLPVYAPITVNAEI